MERSRLLKFAREVLTQPTAPLHEDAIKEVVRRFCRQRPSLGFVHDRWGNLVVHYSRGSGHQPIVFEAHMDHPGFEILETADSGKVSARFLGGVPVEAFQGKRVRVFAHTLVKFPVRERQKKGVKGVVTWVDKKNWNRDKRVTLSVNGPVCRGDFAVWELNPFQLRGGRLYTRACDDLVGCVAMLAVLDELVRRRIKGDVRMIFTRAEEVGFLGALALARDRTIPSSAIVIGIETSKEIPAVKMGRGPIIRVGDRATTFNSDVTLFLNEVALRLQAKDRKFAFQRALMDGGICESTVYHQQGYRTGAVCVALGNYHNHDGRRNIRQEYISFADLSGMVDLFVGVIREANEFEEIADGLNRRLGQLYQDAKRRLQPPRIAKCKDKSSYEWIFW